MPLDPAVIAATSGILGSIVGALSSLGTTFMTQRLQARRERVSLELAKREELYGQFIEEATPLFADSKKLNLILPRSLICTLFSGAFDCRQAMKSCGKLRW